MTFDQKYKIVRFSADMVASGFENKMQEGGSLQQEMSNQSMT